MNSRRRVALAILFVGSASCWAPNSHRPVKPATAKQPTFMGDFRPVEWAAAGMVAASLAFSPLPSNAANGDGAPMTIPAVETIAENTRDSTSSVSISNVIESKTMIAKSEELKPVVVDNVATTTLLANNEEASKPAVEAKKEEPKKDAAAPVEKKKEEPPKVEVAKAEQPKEAQKDSVVASAPATTVAKKEEPPKVEVAKAEKPKEEKKDPAPATTIAKKEEPPKAVEAKKEEIKKDAAPVEKKKEESPKVELAKAEKPKEAKKDAVVASTPAPAPPKVEVAKADKQKEAKKDPAPATTVAKKEAPKSSTMVASKADTGAKKKDDSASPDASALALAAGVLAGSVVALGASTKGRPIDDYNPNRYTNSADSNAPYSRDVYESGSYSSGAPISSRSRNGSWLKPRRSYSSSRPRYSSTGPSNPYTTAPRYTNSADSNAPYAQDVYESGSYSSGFTSPRRSTTSMAPYREDRKRKAKARQWNETIKRRNRAGYRVGRYGPDAARKNGSVINYIREDRQDMNLDGYNPKEPW